jgi:predicted XRE-type DNA-binding protein
MKTQRAAKKSTVREAITRGSDNVFADLGFPAKDAAELKIKAGLTLQIYQRINELGLTQVRAAQRLGLSQPDVSKLMNGRHSGYSVERLLSLLNALEVDVDIVVRPRHHGRKVRVGVVRVLEVADA